MIVDVSYKNMSIEEMEFDAIRGLDTIVHEAEMDMVMDRYIALKESTSGTDSKFFIVRAVKKLFRSVVDFFRKIKNAISDKLRQIKDNHAKKVASKKANDVIDACKDVVDNLESDTNDLLEKIELDKVELDTFELDHIELDTFEPDHIELDGKVNTTSSKSNGILGKFKGKCQDAINKIRNKSNPILK